MECAKMLLDRGAKINMQNKVRVSLYTVYMQCKVCTETLFSTCMYCYLISATGKEGILGVMHTSLTTDAPKDKCNELITCD